MSNKTDFSCHYSFNLQLFAIRWGLKLAHNQISFKSEVFMLVTHLCRLHQGVWLTVSSTPRIQIFRLASANLGQLETRCENSSAATHKSEARSGKSCPAAALIFQAETFLLEYRRNRVFLISWRNELLKFRRNVMTSGTQCHNISNLISTDMNPKQSVSCILQGTVRW